MPIDHDRDHDDRVVDDGPRYDSTKSFRLINRAGSTRYAICSQSDEHPSICRIFGGGNVELSLALKRRGELVDKKEPVKGAHNCKWAEPTLFEPAPEWVEAEAKPWTCHRDAEPRHLETTEVCEDCPRWEERDGAKPGPTAKP